MTHGASKEKMHELLKIDDFLSFFSIIYCHTMETDIDKNIVFYHRGLFSTGAMGALAPAIFGHFSTVGKNCGC